MFDTQIHTIKNSMCELCGIITDKHKKGRTMVKKCFVIHEEVVDIFHEIFIFQQWKNFHLILLISGLLVQGNVGRLEIIFSALMHQKTI